MLGSFASNRRKSGMRAVKQSASPESGEVARRGKAAATEGLLPLSRLSFLAAFNPSVILALLG